MKNKKNLYLTLDDIVLIKKIADGDIKLEVCIIEELIEIRKKTNKTNKIFIIFEKVFSTIFVIIIRLVVIGLLIWGLSKLSLVVLIIILILLLI